MDKFILGTNPQRPDSNDLYIIHLLHPQAIITCIKGHIQTDNIYEHFSFQNSEAELEEWTLDIHFFHLPFEHDPEKKLKPLLKKAWRWYRAYLKSKSPASCPK